MSHLVGIWDQAQGIAGMVTARCIIAILEGGTTGGHLVPAHTYWLVQSVNGEPPETGWTRRHLSVALDVALEEIKEGQPGYWIPN